MPFPPQQRLQRRGKRGFVLLAVALSLVAIIAVLGLSIDAGRLYLVRGEAQTYADAAALAAALELDGTTEGLERATHAVNNSVNRWHFGMERFQGTRIDFAVAAAGPWEAHPAAPEAARFVRVVAVAPVPLYFLPAVTRLNRTNVAARATAGPVSGSPRVGLVP